MEKKIRKNKTGLFYAYAGYLFNAVTDSGEKTMTEIFGIPICQLPLIEIGGLKVGE